MSLEAIQTITGAEQAVREQKARAADEARAGEHSAQTLGDSAAQCESLKQAARGRLEQAAGLIVGRVGNS